MNDFLQKTSRIRQDIKKLAKEIEELVGIFIDRKPFTKGSVYKMKSKCGKPNCACAKGAVHERWVLSFSSEGRTRIHGIPREKLSRLQEATQCYQSFRKARSRLVHIHKQMLEYVNALDEARRERL